MNQRVDDDIHASGGFQSAGEKGSRNDDHGYRPHRVANALEKLEALVKCLFHRFFGRNHMDDERDGEREQIGRHYADGNVVKEQAAESDNGHKGNQGKQSVVPGKPKGFGIREQKTPP